MLAYERGLRIKVVAASMAIDLPIFVLGFDQSRETRVSARAKINFNRRGCGTLGGIGCETAPIAFGHLIRGESPGNHDFAGRI
jgi:hypothetical protein